MVCCYVPTVCQLRGSVIWRCWFQVFLVTVFAGGIVALNEFRMEFKVRLPNNVLPVLGVVTALLLGFRTNTAYDRYWEGRKYWSKLVSNIRTLTRTFWITLDDKQDPKLIVEKLSVINLLVAFAYATKHYLREEYSYEEEDLVDLVGHLPQLWSPSSNEPLELQEAKSRKLFPTKNDKLLSKISIRYSYKSRKQKRRSSHFHQDFSNIPTNIPLEISYFISSYIKYCKDRDLLDSPTCRILDNAVVSMVDCLTGFERIRRTPIPLAYSVHLHHVTWIIVLAVPFQYAEDLKWFTVLVATLSAFALFGVLAIGREIENPFGYDYNDLNLDDFCKIIHKETMALTAQSMPPVETWMFSESNRPITLHSKLTASGLAKMKVSDIHHILLQGKDYKFSHGSDDKSPKNP